MAEECVTCCTLCSSFSTRAPVPTCTRAPPLGDGLCLSKEILGRGDQSRGGTGAMAKCQLLAGSCSHCHMIRRQWVLWSDTCSQCSQEKPQNPLWSSKTGGNSEQGISPNIPSIRCTTLHKTGFSPASELCEVWDSHSLSCFLGLHFLGLQ